MRIFSNNSDQQKLIDAVYAAGQGHVFRFWNELGLESRTKLLAQLREIDLELMATLNQEFIQSTENHLMQQKLEPADFISLPKPPEEIEAFNNAKKLGEKALKAGRVAAFWWPEVRAPGLDSMVLKEASRSVQSKKRVCFNFTLKKFWP